MTPRSSSNMFLAMANDGYQQRVAMPDAGEGLLVYDPSGGAITQANQTEFTLWDPTAANDMQALEDVFDTNHDGVLNASDSSFGNFRILVTNANGTTTLETLAQAGVTSINLQTNTAGQTLPDGTAIKGESTFTRSNGTTGTAAAYRWPMIPPITPSTRPSRPMPTAPRPSTTRGGPRKLGHSSVKSKWGNGRRRCRTSRS